MTHQLRPLNLGEILDRTAELYRNNFLLFAGIAAIFAGAMLLTQMLHLGGLSVLGYPQVAARLQWVVAAVAVLQALVVLLIAGLSVAANTRAVAWIHLGEPATIRASCLSIVPRLRRYLWVMTIAGFRAWAPLAVMYVAFFAILFTFFPKGFLTNPAIVQSTAAQNPTAVLEAGLGFLLLSPFFMGALVYGILMSLRYALAVPACVVEDLPARPAIRRSIELSKGTRGRIFVLGILVGVVRLVLLVLVGFPLIVFAFKHVGHVIPIGLLAFQQIGVFVVNTFIGPIYSTGLTLFYYDQRIRKEGFDIEWMMRAAGLSCQAALPATEQA
ncbi:MAG: hypothetical protein WBE72_05800 [Terracidiphilus sp.]